MAEPASPDAPRTGIAFLILGMALIAVNDTVVKFLSDAYPLHQIVLVRALFGMAIALAILQLQGGLALLRTRRPGLHAFRALLLVLANSLFFAALAVLPLATATAAFFVAPLFITLLSVPVLGERVGARRLVAVVLGFLGVLVMVRPEAAGDGVPGWTYALPVLGALAYAGLQVLTRKLGAESPAAALAVYIQLAFLLASGLMWTVFGDGAWAEATDNGSLRFLLRAWRWPEAADWPLLVLVGLVSGVLSLALSQAYRLGAPSLLAPFEYVLLPMAMILGWLVFGEVPGPRVWAGTALIAGAGIYVYGREGRLGRKLAPVPRVPRR